MYSHLSGFIKTPILVLLDQHFKDFAKKYKSIITSKKNIVARKNPSLPIIKIHTSLLEGETIKNFRKVPRNMPAAVPAEVLETPETAGRQFDLTSGDTPMVEAVAKAV